MVYRFHRRPSSADDVYSIVWLPLGNMLQEHLVSSTSTVCWSRQPHIFESCLVVVSSALKRRSSRQRRNFGSCPK